MARQRPATATRTLDRLIATTVFLYVLAVFTLDSVKTYSRACIVLAALLWVLLLAQHRQVRLSSTWHQRLPWVFMLYVLLSLIWSDFSSEAMLEVSWVFSAILGGTGVWMAYRNGLSHKVVPWAMLVGSTILVLSALPQILATGLDGRAYGIAGHPNNLALLLCFAAVVIWSCTTRLPRWMHLAGLGLVTVAFLYTGSRKTLFFLAAALVWLAALGIRNLPRGRLWALLPGLAVVLICAVILVGIGPSALWQEVSSVESLGRLQQVFETGEFSYSERELLMSDAVTVWRQSPIIGEGAGQYSLMSVALKYSHSNYTELLANYGIIGLVLYYLVPVSLLVAAVRHRRRQPWVRFEAILIVLLMLALEVAYIGYSLKINWLMFAVLGSLAIPSSQPLAMKSRCATMDREPNHADCPNSGLL